MSELNLPMSACPAAAVYPAQREDVEGLNPNPNLNLSLNLSTLNLNLSLGPTS
jgi:hypothetical protein